MARTNNFDNAYINWLNGRGFEPATRGNVAVEKHSEIRYSWMELDELNDERSKRNKPRMSRDEYDAHKAAIVERRNKRRARKAAEAEAEAAEREDVLVGYLMGEIVIG